MKDWEIAVKDSRNNLWLVTTETAKFLCVKKGVIFLIKDGGAMEQVKEKIIAFKRL